jgi:transposase
MVNRPSESGSRRPRGERVAAEVLDRPGRRERADEIEELATRGFRSDEIAEKLGLARSTVNKYRRDPDGELERARRESYRGRTTLVLDALRMALWRRGPGADVRLVHHSDRGSQGGFNRSSQRSIERSCDGQAEAEVGSGWSACDAIAGASTAGRLEHRQRFWTAIARGLSSEEAAAEAGVSAAVGVRWFREGGGMPSVTLAAPSGSVSVVRRAGGDRDPACRWLWGAGDRTSARSFTVNDLEGAPSQRRDSQRWI